MTADTAEDKVSIGVSGHPARRALEMTVEARPAEADVAALERGLYLYEEARLGSPGHAHFSVLARDADGRLIAGADAHVMWRRAFVKTLWVEEAYRAAGIGRELMARLEAEACRRACRSVWLTALGDPARAFYLRLGYRIVGTLDDYVRGQGLYTLEKTLD